MRARLRAGAIALASAAILAGPTAAAAFSPSPIVRSQGEAHRAASTSYCAPPRGDVRVCGIAEIAPGFRPPCELPVRAGGRFSVDATARARRIKLAMKIASENGTERIWRRIRRSGRGRRIWRFNFPALVQRANVLYIRLDFGQGSYTNAFIGLDSERCRAGDPGG